MKIGIFTPYLDTMSGGERYMLTIAAMLAEGNDVSIFWNTKDEEKYKKIAKDKLGINIDTVSFVDNIFSPSTPALRRIKKSRKFDKIIALSDGSIPFIWTKLYLHFQFPLPALRPSLLAKFKVLSAKKIICNSRFTKKYIDEKFSVRSSVLYPPVKLISPGEKENKILNVGRLSKLEDGTYFKRQDVLISAFKKMVNNGLKDWKLIMVISTKDQKDEDELISLKELTKNYPIQIIHNPTNLDLEKEYSTSKIYWHASGFGQNLRAYPELAEHFGITTVEAMSAGAVPVVFNAGGQKEIIEDNFNGFLWDTLDDLKTQTLKLVNSEETRGKMSEAAVKKAGEFSEDHFKKKIFEIISQ